MIIGENTEGEYSRTGGRVHRTLADEVATETSVFTRNGVERIHGSAFDIDGKGISNPIGTFWTGSMMLEHLGETAPAARLLRAIAHATARADMTPDLAGKGTTASVTRPVCGALRKK